MIEKLKQHWMVLVFSLLVLLAMIFAPKTSTIEGLKSLLRKKKVEDDVKKLQDLLEVEEDKRVESEEKLVEMAEKLKEEKKNLSKMSVNEVQDFYKRMLK